MPPFLMRLLGDARPLTYRAATRSAQSILALEGKFARLSNLGLLDYSARLKAAVRTDPLDPMLNEAFALVREASWRALGVRHYEEQLVGGYLLHHRHVAEMQTGEGKTLVALLPAFLNSLTGRGVHIVTVNDYLVGRDADECQRVMDRLGVSVGRITSGLSDTLRRAAYAADITYAVHSEVGFDYLRDNMKLARRDMVGRPLHYAIIDEVDNVLIDEAQVPLILSSDCPPDDDELLLVAHRAVAHLPISAWEEDPGAHTVHLTDAGLHAVEDFLREDERLEEDGYLHDDSHGNLVSHIQQALRARVLYRLDRDYIVRNGEVVLIDPGNGRALSGRRFGDGQHQAIEALEGVTVQPDNLVVASITYQDFFLLYEGLAGMTGTASVAADELGEMYGLEVFSVPAHRPVIRKDMEDEVYATSQARDEAVARLVIDVSKRGQPVLVGTPSIERSEALSAVFRKWGLTHTVLNARQTADEAHVIAQAGRAHAVTIATNMAGRGTDIRLGGNPDLLARQKVGGLTDGMDMDREMARFQALCAREADEVRAAGGLLVIGTERHENRRIDEQLRGRSGRQGDPGASCFMISLEDSLIRRFGGEQIKTLVTKLAGEEAPLIHSLASRYIRKAQEKCEASHFEARKHLAKYDKITALQRATFYRLRLDALDAEDPLQILSELRTRLVATAVKEAMPKAALQEHWNLDALADHLNGLLALNLPLADWVEAGFSEPETVTAKILEGVHERESAFRQALGSEALATMVRSILLRSYDDAWQDYLQAAELVRKGIGLRSYGARNPLHEWNVESDRLFKILLQQFAESAVVMMSAMKLMTPTSPERPD